ncbi:MAG: proline--tRNA ligase [Patescibacteria group bacterium]
MNKITTRSNDFSQWYQDVISTADLADYSIVRGSMIIKPYGYAIWERIQEELNKLIKAKGVENMYFPLLIPMSLLTKEAEHVEGFAPEVATVTHAGGELLDEPYAIRPTSETIIYETFKGWVHTYRDLPILINQWANVMRWEKRTKLFLRTTEFLWQEGHTVHETAKEADLYAQEMLEVYRVLAEEILAIPVLTGVKSNSERFAGAEKTYTIEAMMQDGKALQAGTSHNLGDHFSKAFDITYTNKENKQEYAYQTSWGVSTRIIGGLIMTHSDDNGLVLPPNIAPIQVVVCTLFSKNEQENIQIQETAKIITEALAKKGIRAKLDNSELRIGEKFFKWEQKGVPVRVEVGARELMNNQVGLFRRDLLSKESVEIEKVDNVIVDLLNVIQDSMLDKAKEYRTSKTVKVSTWDEFQEQIEKGMFVIADYDGTAETESKIKEITKATTRCQPFDLNQDDLGKCIYTGEEAKTRFVFAKSY